MLKLSHSTLTFISGAIWMAIGVFLLQMGLQLLLVQIIEAKSTTPLINLFNGFFPMQEAAIFIAAIALYVGFLKGRYVLAKSAHRCIQHILSLPNPASLISIYSKSYYLLLGSMLLLGMGVKYLGLPNDVRGAIDITIGSALINGATHYFRQGFKLRKPAS
jgi:hypothetical protein